MAAETKLLRQSVWSTGATGVRAQKRQHQNTKLLEEPRGATESNWGQYKHIHTRRTCTDPVVEVTIMMSEGGEGEETGNATHNSGFHLQASIANKWRRHQMCLSLSLSVLQKTALEGGNNNLLKFLLLLLLLLLSFISWQEGSWSFLPSFLLDLLLTTWSLLCCWGESLWNLISSTVESLPVVGQQRYERQGCSLYGPRDLLAGNHPNGRMGWDGMGLRARAIELAAASQPSSCGNFSGPHFYHAPLSFANFSFGKAKLLG